MLAVIRQFYDDRKERVWMNCKSCPDWFDVGRGLRQGFNHAPLLFDLFVAARLRVAFDDLSKDEDGMTALVKVKRRVMEGKVQNAKLLEALKSI